MDNNTKLIQIYRTYIKPIQSKLNCIIGLNKIQEKIIGAILFVTLPLVILMGLGHGQLLDYFSMPVIVSVFITIAFVMLWIKVSSKEKFRVETKYKQEVISPIVKMINPHVEYMPIQGFTAEYLHSTQIFINFTTQYSMDLIKGSSNGLNYTLSQEWLFIRGKYSDNTQFKGLVLSMDTALQVDGVVRLYNKENPLLKVENPMVDKQAIELEDAEFRKIFYVTATDHLEARRILTPDRIELLKNIANTENCGMNIMYSGNMVCVAMNYKSLVFEPEVVSLKSVDKQCLSAIKIFRLVNEFSREHSK